MQMVCYSAVTGYYWASDLELVSCYFVRRGVSLTGREKFQEL